MKLIYCYIENFRNIHNQEVLLSDKFQCQYKDGKMQIEQLEEIRLKVEKLRSWFSVDATQIHRININKASVERMMHHPYINFYQAKVIAEYRKKKGKLRDLKQLALYEEFTSADFERIMPYICYD